MVFAGGGDVDWEYKLDVIAGRGVYLVPELIEALKYDDAMVQSDAAIILGKIGPAAKAATPVLIAALKDRSPTIRFSAAAALWQIDHTAHDVTPILVAALKNQDKGIRRLAAEALAERAPDAHSALAPALIEALKDQDEYRVALNAAIALANVRPPVKEAIPILLTNYSYPRAARALVKMGQEAKDEVMSALVAHITTGYKDKYKRADIALLTNILVEIGGAKYATSALIGALKDQDAGARVPAAIALAQIRPLAKEVIPVLIAECANPDVGGALAEIGREAKDEVVPALIAALTTEQNYHRYLSLTRILAEIGPGAKKAAPVLTKALKNPDPHIRASAAAALWQIDQTTPAVMPVLVEALKDRKSDDYVLAAAVLAKTPPNSPEASLALAPALIDAFKRHRGSDISDNAAIALTQIRPPVREAIPIFLDIAQYPSQYPLPGGGRYAISAFLVKMAQEAKDEVMPTLIEALFANSHNNMKIAWLTDILVKIGPGAKDAAPALIKRLKHEDPAKRAVAAAALWRIDHTAHDVTPILIAALKDRDHHIRLIAAEALAKKPPEANPALISALIGALKDLYNDVAVNAAIALAYVRPPVKEAIPALLTECSLPGANGALVKMGQEAKDEVAQALVTAMTIEPKDKTYCRYASRTEILVKIKGAKYATPLLISALTDQDPSIRYQAAKALGQLGPEAAVAAPTLNKALADKISKVAAEAESALARIQGRARSRAK